MNDMNDTYNRWDEKLTYVVKMYGIIREPMKNVMWAAL